MIPVFADKKKTGNTAVAGLGMLGSGYVCFAEETESESRSKARVVLSRAFLSFGRMAVVVLDTILDFSHKRPWGVPPGIHVV